MRQIIEDVSLNSEMLRLFILIELLVLITSCSPCGNNGPDESNNKIFLSSSSINTTNNLIFEFDYDNNLLDEIEVNGILSSNPGKQFLIYQRLDSLFLYDLNSKTSDLVFVNFDEFIVNDPIFIPKFNKILFNNDQNQMFAMDFNGNIEQLNYQLKDNSKKSISLNGKFITFFDNTSNLVVINENFDLINRFNIQDVQIDNDRVIWSDNIINIAFEKDEFIHYQSYNFDGLVNEFRIRNINLNYPIIIKDKILYFDENSIMQLDADGSNNKLLIEFTNTIDYSDIEFNYKTNQVLISTINDNLKDLYLLDLNDLNNPKEVLLSNNSIKAKWQLDE